MFCVSGEVGQNELDIHKTEDNLFWMHSVGEEQQLRRRKGQISMGLVNMQ